MTSLDRAAIDRIVAETFVERVEVHRELASTNSRALQLGKENAGKLLRTLVFAEKQTAGRGRGTNQWWSADGALTFSVLLGRDEIYVPAERWPMISLAIGLAVSDAISEVVTRANVKADVEANVGLKWPNDVYLQNRKVCGILVEAVHGSPGHVVLGVGVNVNNSIDQAPTDLRDTAIALCDVVHGNVEFIALLVRLLDRIAVRLRSFETSSDLLCRDWHDRCLLTGQTVSIDNGSRQIVGRCQGIDSDGALLVESADGHQRCVSGVVTLVVAGL